MSLAASNRSRITAHGAKEIQIQIRGHGYTFRLAQVTQPMIGVDFITHHRLLVDAARQL